MVANADLKLGVLNPELGFGGSLLKINSKGLGFAGNVSMTYSKTTDWMQAQTALYGVMEKNQNETGTVRSRFGLGVNFESNSERGGSNVLAPSVYSAFEFDLKKGGKILATAQVDYNGKNRNATLDLGLGYQIPNSRSTVNLKLENVGAQYDNNPSTKFSVTATFPVGKTRKTTPIEQSYFGR